MEREDMIKRLKAGEDAIDLSIEKWEDILEDTGIDAGCANCACCYVDCPYDCSTCPISKYEDEQFELNESSEPYDDAFSCNLCGNLPDETDKEGVKKAIEYMKRVKKWMTEN